MRSRYSSQTSVQKQQGAVAVEFALVFVVFFMVMYGAIAYGVVFSIKHSLNLAASEGARAAVRNVGDLSAREALATQTATDAIAWLGARAPTPQVSAGACPSTPYTCLTVKLDYDYAANPIVPSLPALGIQLPAKLDAQATVQLDAL